jgi:Protein of unknown function (DUF3093)
MTRYRERLWPSAWIFIALGLVIPASLLVFLPINQTVGMVTAVVLYLGCAGLLAFTSPVITVTDDMLTAGRAAVPLQDVGELTGYEGAEAVLERGQRLDARAWLVIRGWIAPIVKVEITDPSDPTPYWVVSTRNPGKLIDAVAAARQSGRTAD